MKKTPLIVLLLVIIIMGGFVLFGFLIRNPEVVPVVIVPVETTGDITLAVGETGKVGNLSVTLNAFVQDSRCPIDVTCIQAGAVNVNVTFTDATSTVTKNMPSDEVPQTFGGYDISITDIAPPRHSKQEIAESDYRITFHIAPATKSISSIPPPVKGEILVGGSVTLSPTCPVERVPPDPACAPKPYATKIQVFSANGTKALKTTESQSDGSFAVSLVRGEYRIEAMGGSVYPRCSPVTLSLTTDSPAPVLISCDTGIR